MSIKKRIFTIILSSLFLCMVLSCSSVFAQDNSTTAERLSGIDRYETSVAISKEGWVQANTVIIASGLNYPDALSAASLSKLKDAPILLTEKDALEPVTTAELKRLKATQAFIIGGTGVIGTGVEEQLKGLGISITRIGGTDRFDTSEKVAEIVGANNGIVVASASNFPDALSIAPIAGIKGMPILLSSKDSLNPNIAAFIKRKNIPVSYLVGGTGVLNSSIDSSLPNSKRFSGADRYATNLSINNQFAGDLNFDTIYLASAKDFPDALCGAALAAKNNAPIFLIDINSISDATINFIKSKNVQHVVILGGSGSVSQSVENSVHVAISSLVVHPTSVSLNKTSDTITVGATDTLTANIVPSNATKKSIMWTSSNNSIATVDNTGNVTAVSAGSTIITATTTDGNYATTCNVTVTNPVIGITSISLNKTSDTIAVGATDTLSANIVPNNATNQTITWISSNNAIATVDSSGNITGVSGGSATITVTTTDGNYTANCNVTVTNPVTSISLNKNIDKLSLTGTDTLIATIIPNNATNQSIIWTSSNSAIATVDNNGNVKAVSTGSTTITATTTDGNYTATCNVIVISPVVVVSSVSLNKATDALIVGDTDTLTDSIEPVNAGNQDVTWKSSNNGIATVDNNGNVKAISAGTATITVITIDGSLTASCTVTVTNPNAPSLNLNKTSDSLIVNETDTLVANVVNGSKTNQNVTWTSSNSAVVTVNNTGNVKAISAGVATITATTIDGSLIASCNITVFNQGQGHMLISDSLVNFTASYEGYSATPYVGADSQNYTIGYGHVIVSGENYTNLTQPQAWNLLRQDLQNADNGVNSFTSDINLSQQQFDALVDFAYNCGVAGLQNSTLLKDIRAGASIDKLKTDFQMWSYCNGTPLSGLYRRRVDEWQIYTSGNYTRDNPTAPNGYM